MAADPMDRIFEKLDHIGDQLTDIQTTAAADRQRLASHLMECADRTAAIHKRIDDVQEAQRWWSGKIVTAALGGGGMAEIMRHLFGGRSS